MQRVSIVDDRERVMEVVVEDKQLSLAIGKKGQNVRLAAKLTGWRIDIKSEEEKRREVEAQFGELAAPDACTGTSRCRPPGGWTADAEVAADAEVVADAEVIAGRIAGGGRQPVPYTLAGIGEKTVRRLVESGFDDAGSARRRDRGTARGDSRHRRQDRREILAAARGDAPAAGENSADV